MPSKPQPDRFLNYAQVAEMIGLEIETVKKGKAGTNEIPRIKLGSRVLFSFNAVQRWMECKAREAEDRRRRAESAVVDLLAEQARRKRLIKDTVKTIANGGRYER